MKRFFSFVSVMEAWRLCHASITTSFLALLILCSCSDSNKPAYPEDAIVAIGDECITRTELNLMLPGGITPEDSVKFSKALINSWIDTQLMSQIASKEIDMKSINRMVEQYRNELIANEYLNRMYQAHAKTSIPEDSLLSYYEQHKQEFVLARPMVKGVYLKVDDDAPSLSKLRKIYRSQKENDIDKLDKSELNGALHYDYFRNTWIDWEQIEKRIPYDFGTSPDQFLKNHKNIDFSQGGFTYLLDITDVLYTGQTRPFESAKSQIEDRINFYNMHKYSDELKKGLRQKAEDNGKIRIFCDLDN